MDILGPDLQRQILANVISFFLLCSTPNGVLVCAVSLSDVESIIGALSYIKELNIVISCNHKPIVISGWLIK